MSFKIKGNDPLSEPPPLTSLLNETEKVTKGPSLEVRNGGALLYALCAVPRGED